MLGVCQTLNWLQRLELSTRLVVVGMAATTLTTIVMVIFGSALIGLGLRNLFGNWEPIVKRTPEQIREAEVRREIQRLREQIERYESEEGNR